MSKSLIIFVILNLALSAKSEIYEYNDDLDYQDIKDYEDLYKGNSLTRKIENVEEFCKISNHPYFVTISDNTHNKLLCGGTLITASLTLTAARCCTTFSDVKNIQINVNQKNFSGDGLAFGVKNVYVHPKFHSASLLNDICIIELNKSVPGNIQTVTVKKPNDDNPPLCLFGYTLIVREKTGSSNKDEPEYDFLCKERSVLSTEICRSMGSYNLKSFCTRPFGNETSTCEVSEFSCAYFYIR